VPCIPTNTFNASVVAGTANIEFVISGNANRVFDNTSVVLLRSSKFYSFSSADITSIAVDKNEFEIIQNNTTLVDGAPYIWSDGDQFFCKVEGKSLGVGRNDNPVAIARDILSSYGGLLDPQDFDTSWDTIEQKFDGLRPEDSIRDIPARLWIQDQQESLTVALSLLEQVRVEAFIGKNQKLNLTTLHFNDLASRGSQITVKPWDIERNTLKPRLDLRNQINRAKGFFNFLPDLDDNFYRTNFFRNQAALQQIGKPLEKGLVFPNLYTRADVNRQVIESLKLTSGFFEEIEVTQTWRSMLLEIGDFVTLEVTIGGTDFNKIPCLVRDISYSAKGLKIPIKYWSFMVLPFGTWPGQGSGIVAGETATITEET
jgi:hypothetical protein